MLIIRPQLNHIPRNTRTISVMLNGSPERVLQQLHQSIPNVKVRRTLDQQSTYMYSM
jgi:hypothetical protein